jgi:NAD(P)H dehydrogenase (quinone)
MRIAVTGATGSIGGQVVDLLSADGEHDVVAISRSAPPPQHPKVRSVSADYDDQPTLRRALRGAETLVFVSSDGNAVHVLVHHENVIRAAVESGVGHIVALSGLDADLRSPFCYAVSYAYTERLLRESGCAISLARASIYTEFFLTWLREARTTGELRLSAGDGRVSLVARDDVARSHAALALTAPTGRVHEITGPEALTGGEIAARAGEVWGVPIDYVSLTSAEHRAEMARAGESPWWEYAYASMFDSVREGRWANVSGDVLDLTGRRPRPLEDVLQAH